MSRARRERAHQKWGALVYAVIAVISRYFTLQSLYDSALQSWALSGVIGSAVVGWTDAATSEERH